jgi:hypothetical protein
LPSHPDRVRRNYHDVNLIEYDNICENKQEIKISITKTDIASRMGKWEIVRHIEKLISQAVIKQYKE